MKTCDTCKWWGFVDTDNKPLSNGARECGNPKLDPQANGEDCFIQVGNDAGWNLNFTGPKFGCIHWQHIPLPALNEDDIPVNHPAYRKK